MNNFVKLAVPASLAVLLAACGQSGTSTLPGGVAAQSQTHQIQSVQKLQDGITLYRHDMPIVGHQAVHSNLSGLLNWGGGAVQHSPEIYVVFWGFKGKAADPDGVEKLDKAFLKAVGGTPWLSTVTQYYDNNGDINNPKGQYKGFLVDKSSPVGSPTDQQIQAEAAKLVAKFGANANASYVVQTPYGHNTSGFGTQWCAYHGAFTSGGTIIPYTNLPYIPEAGQSCGANFVNQGTKGTNDGVTIVEGHELAETQTDPGADYSGWGGQDGEIGDICAWDSTTSNQPFGKTTYPVQPLYSDVSSSCTLTGPKGP